MASDSDLALRGLIPHSDSQPLVTSRHHSLCTLSFVDIDMATTLLMNGVSNWAGGSRAHSQSVLSVSGDVLCVLDQVTVLEVVAICLSCSAATTWQCQLD